MITWSLGLLLITLCVVTNAQATEDQSMGLFVNLSTSQTATAGHAMHFASNMLERGHPVVFFLNHQAVACGFRLRGLRRRCARSAGCPKGAQDWIPVYPI
ncbi:hypothetical protein [Thiocapsa marina]|uniref:Uncharacterized protein n=1 Tax=Thiocapsa marina 5811 TaxID=768671 RepID=F9U7A7_9GAMM|nr:hypothetical protein [Thiocapsa marina]EGV20133.1 hypothetical protein ThimaDRAFT_0809 [Thiocapsa marina 5811]